MIAYRDIYEAAKKERYSENLQPILKTFIVEVAKYMKDKRDASSKSNDVFSDALIKTKKQLENAITLFQELLRRRRKKILNLVLIAAETGVSKQDFKNMLSIEKSLFEDMMKCIDRSDKKLNELLNGQREEESEKNNLIVFLVDVAEFVAPTGEVFGPFTTGQFANVPKEIANIFLDDRKAELMEK